MVFKISGYEYVFYQLSVPSAKGLTYSPRGFQNLLCKNLPKLSQGGDSGSGSASVYNDSLSFDGTQCRALECHFLDLIRHKQKNDLVFFVICFGPFLAGTRIFSPIFLHKTSRFSRRMLKEESADTISSIFIPLRYKRRNTKPYLFFFHSALQNTLQICLR